MVSLLDGNTASRAELALRHYRRSLMRRVNDALLFWRGFFLDNKQVNGFSDSNRDE
jgi:hypothetical protein